MKSTIKQISIVIIFLGVFLSCFQLTITHFSKNYKVASTESSSEDVDDAEDDSDTNKIEFEDEYNVSEFNHCFHKTNSDKISLQINRLMLHRHPVIAINTPPPEA